MRKFGLIGFPLTHSFSKKYFEEKFKREEISKCSYDLFELKSIEEFPALIKSHIELKGLNVTIPYKEAVIPFLDEMDYAAREIRAVNCIVVKDRRLTGTNTDCYGFEISLQKLLDANPDQTFVLGTGGSSKAVQYVLKKLGIPFFKVSRVKKEDTIAYADILSVMGEKNLFINTTPIGMFPKVSDAPDIPYEKLTANDFLFDLIYNPAETEFLKRGKARGAKTNNGLEMLELQAEKSWEIWNS